MGEFRISDVPEIKRPDAENYKEIKPQSGITINDARKFWDDKFSDKIEMIIQYFSTYEERIDKTPKEDSNLGTWDGARGESEFRPADEKLQKLLSEFGLEGINYKDGIPDFSECAESTVKIENMSENRPRNFRQSDEKCAEQWNKIERDGRTDWTGRDVEIWRGENNYTWHERNDMKTCDLVPFEINGTFKHLGGVSECKKRDAKEMGGMFDE